MSAARPSTHKTSNAKDRNHSSSSSSGDGDHETEDVPDTFFFMGINIPLVSRKDSPSRSPKNADVFGPQYVKIKKNVSFLEKLGRLSDRIKSY